MCVLISTQNEQRRYAIRKSSTIYGGVGSDGGGGGNVLCVVLQIYHQERSFSPCSNIQACSLVNKIGARKKECRAYFYAPIPLTQTDYPLVKIPRNMPSIQYKSNASQTPIQDQQSLIGYKLNIIVNVVNQSQSSNFLFFDWFFDFQKNTPDPSEQIFQS